MALLPAVSVAGFHQAKVGEVGNQRGVTGEVHHPGCRVGQPLVTVIDEPGDA
ncbi:hypothetical protein [Novosphingobium aquae]|uniref:Uncharacterized protein n=1 Tax=Novosphingobium aquae TaxID=3133435 RepID=A0ABU8S5J7_9SPHN